MKNVFLVKNMQIKLREDKKNYTTLSVLFVATILISLFGVFISDIVLPVSAALLAVIFLLEHSGKKYFSVFASVIILASNALSVFLLEGFIFSGVETVLLAAIIAFCFSKNTSKAEAAFLLTAVASIFIVLNAIFFAMVTEGRFDFQTVKLFYTDLYELIKSELVSSLSLLKDSLPENSVYGLITSDDVVRVLDSFIAMLVSFIAISGFVIAGFALKIFSVSVSLLSGEKEIFSKWRFGTGNMFAYFYLVLFVLQIFTAGAAGLFAVLVANLSNIFCVVYAYLGFNFALTLLSHKRSVAFSFIMLLIGLVFFSSLMVEILSIIGAFVTISENKVVSRK